MTELCRGEMTDRKGAPKCQRRTECAHYRATLDWLATPDWFVKAEPFAPELPAGWTITHRLCQTTEYERFQRREGSP